MAKPLIATVNSFDPVRIGAIREVADQVFTCIAVEGNLIYTEGEDGQPVWVQGSHDFWAPAK